MTTRRMLRRLTTTVVGVPDPLATGAFLTDGLGFALADGPGGSVRVLCAGDFGGSGVSEAITLVPAPELGLVELCFELLEGVEPEALQSQIAEHGGRDARTDGDALRFLDPNGIGVVCSPPTANTLPELGVSGLRPRRLGHANIKVPDPVGGGRFWVRALGMSLSEQIGDDLLFLRLDAEHHNLGLRTGDDTDLHHLGFEIPGWDAYRPLLDQLASAGYRVEFGPGRHGVGRNLFTYVCDPDSGLRIELFADMASVGHQDDPEVAPIRWRAEDRMSRTLNTWGSAPPPQSFLD